MLVGAVRTCDGDAGRIDTQCGGNLVPQSLHHQHRIRVTGHLIRRQLAWQLRVEN